MSEEKKPTTWTAVPFGFCPACITRMTGGEEQYEVLQLAGEGRMVVAYCEHREAGATLILRPDRPQRWQIFVPIDAIEWRQLVAMRAGAYDAGRAALADQQK